MEVSRARRVSSGAQVPDIAAASATSSSVSDSAVEAQDIKEEKVHTTSILDKSMFRQLAVLYGGGRDPLFFARSYTSALESIAQNIESQRKLIESISARLASCPNVGLTRGSTSKRKSIKVQTHSLAEKGKEKDAASAVPTATNLAATVDLCMASSASLASSISGPTESAPRSTAAQPSPCGGRAPASMELDWELQESLQSRKNRAQQLLNELLELKQQVRPMDMAPAVSFLPLLLCVRKILAGAKLLGDSDPSLPVAAGAHGAAGTGAGSGIGSDSDGRAHVHVPPLDGEMVEATSHAAATDANLSDHFAQQDDFSVILTRLQSQETPTLAQILSQSSKNTLFTREGFADLCASFVLDQDSDHSVQPPSGSTIACMYLDFWRAVYRFRGQYEGNLKMRSRSIFAPGGEVKDMLFRSAESLYNTYLAPPETKETSPDSEWVLTRVGLRFRSAILHEISRQLSSTVKVDYVDPLLGAKLDTIMHKSVPVSLFDAAQQLAFQWLQAHVFPRYIAKVTSGHGFVIRSDPQERGGHSIEVAGEAPSSPGGFHPIPEDPEELP